ncbi:MAG TPA: NB-ARC domain-containing protein [Chloroflexia bacterium]|nr:NB-ARC domain-containing protein [Chloroflexia bacterium]
MSMENFRAKLKRYLRQSGYSQKQLAHELGMHPAQLSNKFNEHNYANLTHYDVKQIVKVLATWKAISTRQEAIDFLAEVGLGFNSFQLAEWNTAPLVNLVDSSSAIDFMSAKATIGGSEVLELNPEITSSRFDSEETSVFGQPFLPESKPVLREEQPGSQVYVKELYGRKTELAWLEQQVDKGNARLVGLVGIGGVGKTALAIEFSRAFKTHFDYCIWYSLQNAPPLETTLVYFLNSLLELQSSQMAIPSQPEQQLNRLLDCLRKARCLLILDNFETILAGDKQSGTYLSGYEGYGQLLELIGEQFHQSTLLFTSREKPKELVIMQKRYPNTVMSLEVEGLSTQAGRYLLEETGNRSIKGTDQEWEQLITYYSGNPLALKLLAESIQVLFGGNIKAFLQQGWGVFADIEELLKQQFNRLSNLEQQILYWMTAERQSVSLEELKADFRETKTTKELAEGLVSLRRRSLVEISQMAGYFELQPVILEYLTERLVNQVVEELVKGEISSFLGNFALLKAETKDYIRESQRILVLSQVLTRLELALESHNREAVSQHLWHLLEQLKSRSLAEQGYEAGNLINLLVALKADLNDADFSRLRIWQANLQGVALEGVNMALTELRGTLFTSAFGAIEAVAFSPDGQFVASSGLKGLIRLWEVSSGQCRDVFEGHSDRVWSLAFSPQKKLLASASADFTIRVWSLDGEKRHTIYQGHTGEVFSVAFSPDGKLLASGSADHSIRLWEVESGQCLKVLAGHTNEVWSVVFSPDGKLLASGSADQTIRLWNLDDYECLKIISGDMKWVWSVAFSPDGQTVASGNSDYSVRLWELASGQCQYIFQGHTNRVYTVAFSPDGKLLASGSSDQTIRVWDLSSKECRSILQGHLNLIKSVSFSPDGKLLASGSPDQSIRLWEIESGQCLRVHEGYSNRINCVSYSPDGKWLASGSDDNTIRLWEVTTAKLNQTLRNPSFVKSLAFSPNGKLLASGGADNLIRIWDITRGNCLSTLRGYPSWVWSLEFSPDGQILANSGNDNSIYLWEITSGRCVKILKGHTNFIRKIAFRPDGKLLASASNDSSIRLWDVSSGCCLKTFQGHASQVWVLAFSPDGQNLASGSADHTVRLWEVASGQCIKTLQERVWVVCFSPDGQYLVSSGYDLKVKVWSTKNWQFLYDLQGNENIIRTLTFDPGGSVLVGGDENYLRLWDFHSRTLVHSLKTPGLYEGLNIYGLAGLNAVQEDNLLALGAVRIATSSPP